MSRQLCGFGVLEVLRDLVYGFALDVSGRSSRPHFALATAGGGLALQPWSRSVRSLDGGATPHLKAPEKLGRDWYYEWEHLNRA